MSKTWKTTINAVKGMRMDMQKFSLKKQLANIITGSRILGAITLFFFDSFSPAFLTIFILCAFSDAIDGPIARKTNSTSMLGNFLDTMGDFFTYIAMGKVLIVQNIVTGGLITWLVVGVLFGICVAGYAKYKFNKFYLTHTYLSKLMGFMLFALPIVMQFTDGFVWMIIIGVGLCLNLVEILIIQIIIDEPIGNTKSVFHVKKQLKSK